ncbi:MAG: GDP-mannose 4,6-dehydratase [Armatimonadaceae bacterium]
MRILITGATGFAGGWLAQELAQSHPEASLFGMSHRGGDQGDLPNFLPEGMQILAGDLENPNTLQPLIQTADPDVVFHLAGFASGAGTDRDRIFRLNVGGTEALLQLLSERKKPCRVLLASSGYVYGATNPGSPALESDTPQPSGAYAASKWAMEQAVQPYSEKGNLFLTIVRSFNHTGPRQTPAFVIPGFARQIARIEQGQEEPVVRHGNLEAIRDFLHVRDVVRAYRMLMVDAEPSPWRLVNICSGQGYVIRELLEKLLAQAQVKVTQEQDPERMRPSDLPECVGSPSRLQEITGWQPEVSIEATLEDTLNYWRETGRTG